MEEDVLTALRSRAVYLPGCSDSNGRALVVVNVPHDPQQPWNKNCLETCISYIRKSLSPKAIKAGLTVILDGEKYSTRVTKSQCRTIGVLFEDSLAQFFLVRAEGFWDKHIDHCAKNHCHGEPIIITKSRLSKYFDVNQLPTDLGGSVAYNHDRWLQNRVRIEEFRAKYRKTTKELEHLHAILLNHKTLNVAEVTQAMKSCEQLYADVQLAITRTIESGNQLTANINDCYRVPPLTGSIDFLKMPQDIAGELDAITERLNEIEKKQSEIRCAWSDLQKTIHAARELEILERDVAFVIKWILGVADKKLNRDTRVGCDVVSCEELRRENDLLEMQCQEVYAYRIELLYQIESCSSDKDCPAFRNILAKREFMDFLCRSFAARLEKRRGLLTCSLRFFRLVSKYFDRTSEVFESLVMGYKGDDFEQAAIHLAKLKESQSNLENMEKGLVREGTRLVDLLSVTLKDVLGREVGVDYSDDIANIRDILDVTMARRNIFIDSVELQKLTLEQVTHIHGYEKDAKLAIKCMEDLYSTLVRCQSHVGCTVFEIQMQKEELQTFQETGKGIHNLGCQLLEAALALRHSCKLKLETKSNRLLRSKLRQIWSNLQTVIQENMTRLRVSAVFHRNVEDHCLKLMELKVNVAAIGDVGEREMRRVHLERCLVLRDRVLMEVRRMVRLGRLLKTRLKEPFVLESARTNDNDNTLTSHEDPLTPPETVLPTGGNSIACSAISSKILEVADAVESLDNVLGHAQGKLGEHEEDDTSESDKKSEQIRAGSADDMSCSVRSTEDESYATASEYNGTVHSSQGSSYHTASEQRTSPWWSLDKSSIDECSEISTETARTPQTSGIMSANTSFDSSELSFRTVQESPDMDRASQLSHQLNINRLKVHSPSEDQKSSDESAIFVDANDSDEQDKDEARDTPVPESGDLYFIKVIEVEPKLTALGNNIDEAVGQQREHDELLKQLQSLPTPVEEFVMKADNLLAARQANPQVLDAMGQTLNMVWEDILKLLHDRKHLLDLCANFHEKMGSCRGKMASLEVACKDTMIPIEIEAVQEFLHKFKQLRIDVLTAVMSALKDGNELLARLQELAQSGTLDSRPEYVKKDAQRAINQVQQWLEDLHDRRNMLEAAWQTRKTQLEQCLALAMLAKELDALESALAKQKNSIPGVFSLGECEHTSKQYLQEYIDYKSEALSLRDKGVKITRATEKLVESGCFAGDEACSRAYAVLATCTEHVEQLDQKEQWLHQSKEFFGRAEHTLAILERLEIQLSNVSYAPDSPEAFALYSRILKDLAGLTNEPLRLGYAILDEVGRTKPETHGVKRVLDEIENRKIYVEKICSASTEQQVMVTQALNEFLEEYNQLLSWLMSIAEAFLRTNNTMGITLAESKSFLHLHHKLMQDLERKGEEINMLLTKIKQFVNSLDVQQKHDVDTKIESLHKHWIELKGLVIKRVDLVSIYIEFLECADKLAEKFGHVEKQLNETAEEGQLQHLEAVWTDLKGAFGHLKAVGLRFLNVKVADPYLETKSACSHVEEILNGFSNRQFNITSSWEKWTTNIVEKREVHILLERIMTENMEVVNQATKLDAQLYPILTAASRDPRDLSEHTKRKLKDTLQDIDRAQREVRERISATSSVPGKDAEVTQRIEQIVSNLGMINHKLESVRADYKILLEQTIDFLDNVSAVRQAMERHFEQKLMMAGDRAKVERDFSDHNAFRENIMDKFRMLNAQCGKLIERVRATEPAPDAEHDADIIISMLEQLRLFFEGNYEQMMSALEKSQRITRFHEEIGEINTNLSKVGKQLDDVREQQIDHLGSAKTASLAFEYFERTIELLEKQIEHFIQTTETIQGMYPDDKDEISGEVNKLREKWLTFRDQVRWTRSFLDRSCDYFALLEVITEGYRSAHTFLISTSNRIPFLQNPVEVSNLVNDIEKYVATHEEPQMRRLDDLRAQFEDLPGKEQLTTKHYDSSVALFNSFIKLKIDLNVVIDRLKNEEKDREMRAREEQERLERLKREIEEKERLRKELEEQDRRQRIVEEQEKVLRLQREIEEKERLRKELEEQDRRQRIVEEQERAVRIQREVEEKERLRRELEDQERQRRDWEEKERLRKEFEEKERLRRELEDQERQRRDWEEKERMRKEIEEKERLRREFEEKERLRREIEVQERLRRELEEKDRLRREFEEKEQLRKEREEQDRLRRELEDKERQRRELEEQERLRRELEEKERLRRELDEKERVRREFEEKERLRRELEEQERLRRDLEEKERIRREVDEKERLQREIDEQERVRREFEEQQRRQLFLAEQEELRRKIEEQERLLRLQEETQKIQRERDEFERIRRQTVEEERIRKHTEEQEVLKRQIEENQRIQQQLIEDSQRQVTEFHTRTEINEILSTEIRYSSPVFIQPLQDVTIKEGERITLSCQVVGRPDPTVEWFKDGVSIQNNPDYRTTADKGFCTLSIDETFTADSARFLCRASNLVGTADTIATLSVKEQHQELNAGMVPPTIVRYLQDGMAREGSSFQFSCIVSGNPLPTVQWFKDSVCIDDSQYYLITYNNGEATLRFEEVFLEDQAVFTCKAFNPVGGVECSARLVVDPLEPTELPSFVVPVSNAMGRVGQKIKLECVVAGLPPPEVFWMHNGKPYVGREVKFEGDRATLIIPEAYPKDAGVYLVTAKNIAGEAYSTCNVAVKGRLPNETSDSEMASDLELIKPSVQLPLKDVSVFEGKSVRLDCVIVGQPEPEVIWYHNERPVKESSEVQLLFQGDRCSLVIQEAYLEDAGSYKVVAINSAGEASSGCNLSVTPLNISEHATRMQAERIVPIESPPKFEKFLTDVLANEGDTVEFECSVVGEPPLTVKWYLSNKEICESDRLKITNEPKGVIKLIISQVSADDKGVYTVKVSNSSGDAKCFSHLIVKSVNAPDNQQRPPQLEPEERSVCPTFKELFSDRNAHSDETVKFECIVLGRPTPKIRWYFNDLPVHGKHFLVSTSGDRQVLTVQAACPETVGKIACIAENEVGKATCVAHLGLVDQLGQPSSLVNMQRLTEEHSSGSSLVTIKKQMFTSTSTSQISAVQNGIPQTKVHETVQRVDHDFKQINDRAPEIVESREYKEFRSGDAAPMTIQQNTINVQKTGVEIEPPPHKIVRKQIAPRFMSPLIGKIVDQGADVYLEAIYDGFPSPEVKVQKNGEDLFDTDRVKIIKELNKVKINLSGVGVRDAGRYSIMVSNAAGSSTSTADVVVKKTIFPPVFGHRLQAQVAKRGERVIMDVEVTGMPEPTITWYKDNKPLPEALKSEFKLKDEGNSHTLIINKVQTADSGKYMVVATNAGGEAQSIADFAVLEPTPERMVEVVKTVVYDDMKDFKQEASKSESSSSEAKKIDTPIKTDVLSSNESTIITEHRRTTEATMRLEHKASFLDLELPSLKMPIAKPTNTETEYKPFFLHKEGPAQESKILPPKIPPPPQREPQFEPQPTTSTSEENSSIETSSITKKSAYEFFKSMQTAPQPVAEEKYTRFEDMRRASPSVPYTMPTSMKPSTPTSVPPPASVAVRPPKTDFTSAPTTAPASSIWTQQQATSSVPKVVPSAFASASAPVLPPKQTSSVETMKTSLEELVKLDLTPGPPPEFGFIPKPETRTGEHITDRIKMLEESQKSHMDAPNGGIRTLPDINRREEHTMYSKESTYEFSSGPVYRPAARLATPTLPSERGQSPKPSAEGIAMEKLWASPRHFEHEKFLVDRSKDSQDRKQFSCTESDSEFQQIEETSRRSSIKETKQIFEEKIKQAIKAEELKAPALVKQFCPPTPTEPLKPIPETVLDVQLEPGSPPEICYAPKPVLERKQSLVEMIEQKLDLDKEPTKVPPHSVRIIPPPKRDVPPPLPPKDFSSPIPTVTEKRFEEFKTQSETLLTSKLPPPTVPPKLTRYDVYESDYESDKWKFSESESDEPAYRSVKPPPLISHPPAAFVAGAQTPQPAHETLKPKPVSGYMADTEESVFRQSEYQHQSSVQANRKLYESYEQPSEPLPGKLYRQHHPARSSYPEDTVQSHPKDYSSSAFTKNISMTTTNLKEVTQEEPQLEPFPFKPDPPRPRPPKVPPPPSPSKFVKGEFRESDYGSDYDDKIPPVWKPTDADLSDRKAYRPIRPVLTPTGRRSALSEGGESPIPPTQFDNPPKFEGPPRPKFEPIKHEEAVKVQSQQHVYKPKPVQARFVPTHPDSAPQQRPNYTTQYYTAVAGAPLHNASMATETSRSVQMKESSETCQRVVNMSQTHRVIHFDNQKSSQQTPLEPLPYTPSPVRFASPRPRVQLPTPTKFVPRELRESDYESEVDGARIRPVWTPNPSDNEEPQFRHVHPPRPSRSTSLPRTYDRVMTPMEFDRHPPEMPAKSPIDATNYQTTNQSYKSNTMRNYSSQKTYNTRSTRDDMNLKVGSPPNVNYTSEVNHQMKDFGSTFRSKTSKFIEDVSSDLKSTHLVRPGFKRAPSEDDKPQAYREESRVSQHGTKHIDPDTGLVYFKYDFGYEFGIIFPGEGKRIVGGMRNQAPNVSLNAKPVSLQLGPSTINNHGEIVIPVQHERTSSSRSVSRQNGFTSEGELSEPEYDGHARKRYSLPLDINIDRLHAADANPFVARKPVAESPSTVPVNAHLNREDRPKRPPVFITPLKDIAVVMGQTARFECIVQCDPHPQVVWLKNGYEIQPSNKHIIEFRNGVCRLTIPEAYPDETTHNGEARKMTYTTVHLEPIQRKLQANVINTTQKWETTVESVCYITNDGQIRRISSSASGVKRES